MLLMRNSLSYNNNYMSKKTSFIGQVIGVGLGLATGTWIANRLFYGRVPVESTEDKVKQLNQYQG